MQVCQAVGRPPDYLITYLGQELSANSKIDKDTEKAYVTGAMDERHVQQLVFKFIKDTVQVRLRPASSFSRKRRLAASGDRSPSHGRRVLNPAVFPWQCHNCGNPETTIHIEGKKKNMVLYLTCKVSTRRSLQPRDNNSRMRFRVTPVAQICVSAAQGATGQGADD